MLRVLEFFWFCPNTPESSFVASGIDVFFCCSVVALFRHSVVVLNFHGRMYFLGAQMRIPEFSFTNDMNEYVGRCLEEHEDQVAHHC